MKPIKIGGFEVDPVQATAFGLLASVIGTVASMIAIIRSTNKK